MTGSIIAVAAILILAVGLAAWFIGARGAGAAHGSGVGSFERLEARLEVQAVEMRRLADAARAGDGAAGQLSAQLSQARTSLASLADRDRERQASEVETIQVVRRLNSVLAGGGSKGRAGENVLREQLAALPPDMLATDLRINGKVVEFALALPDGRRLPIDSKWSGDLEIQALEAATSQTERDAAARAVESVVARRAREVAAYLDPSLTAGVAIAAVPDAVYDVLRRAHADALRSGVVIVPYSWALPVLLFLRSLVSRFAGTSDLQACVGELDAVFAAVEQTLENKHARAVTMLQNGNDEMRAQIGKARGSLARASADIPLEDRGHRTLRSVENAL